MYRHNVYSNILLAVLFPYHQCKQWCCVTFASDCQGQLELTLKRDSSISMKDWTRQRHHVQIKHHLFHGTIKDTERMHHHGWGISIAVNWFCSLNIFRSGFIALHIFPPEDKKPQTSEAASPRHCHFHFLNFSLSLSSLTFLSLFSITAAHLEIEIDKW